MNFDSEKYSEETKPRILVPHFVPLLEILVPVKIAIGAAWVFCQSCISAQHMKCKLVCSLSLVPMSMAAKVLFSGFLTWGTQVCYASNQRFSPFQQQWAHQSYKLSKSVWASLEQFFRSRLVWCGWWVLWNLCYKGMAWWILLKHQELGGKLLTHKDVPIPTNIIWPLQNTELAEGELLLLFQKGGAGGVAY